LIPRQKQEWYKEHGERWGQVAPKVEPLLAPNGYFVQMSKTFQLLANRPILARELKILTELRPVYDDELSSTKAMVLTSTLVVDYQDGEESKRLHLAERAELDRLYDKFQRRRAEDGGEWPEYTGSGR